MKRLFAIILIVLLALCSPAFAGYENYETFTLVTEFGYTTVDSTTKVSSNAIWKPRKQTDYLYKDYTENHFGTTVEDADHDVEYFWSSSAGDVISVVWMLNNTVGDLAAAVLADDDIPVLYLYDDAGAEEFRLRIYENGELGDSDVWAGGGPQISTLYFFNITRNQDGGANSTGQIVSYIRTGSHAGVLRATLTCDSNAGEQHSQRYLYSRAGWDTDGSDSFHESYTQNLDINEAVVGLSIPIAQYHYTHH